MTCGRGARGRGDAGGARRRAAESSSSMPRRWCGSARPPPPSGARPFGANSGGTAGGWRSRSRPRWCPSFRCDDKSLFERQAQGRSDRPPPSSEERALQGASAGGRRGGVPLDGRSGGRRRCASPGGWSMGTRVAVGSVGRKLPRAIGRFFAARRVVGRVPCYSAHIRALAVVGRVPCYSAHVRAIGRAYTSRERSSRQRQSARIMGALLSLVASSVGAPARRRRDSRARACAASGGRSGSSTFCRSPPARWGCSSFARCVLSSALRTRRRGGLFRVVQCGDGGICGHTARSRSGSSFIVSSVARSRPAALGPAGSAPSIIRRPRGRLAALTIHHDGVRAEGGRQFHPGG